MIETPAQEVALIQRNYFHQLLRNADNPLPLSKKPQKDAYKRGIFIAE
tara:strand:- start:7623 stop:7766 length:144 start_codon:yes stop_codon:yes gene_type:complete